MPVGSITRGTTNTNRLRRVDRWIADQPEFRRAADPLVVDLGYGAARSPRSSSPSGCVARRDVGCSAWRSTRVACARPRRSSPRCAAGRTPFAPTYRSRSGSAVRGAGARRRLARGDPRVERAAAVRRGRRGGRVVAHDRSARSRRAARRGHVRRTRPRRRVGGRHGWRAADVHDQPAPARPRGLRPSWPSDCRRPSSIGTCPASVHALLAALDHAWQLTPRCRCTGRAAVDLGRGAQLRDEGWPVHGGMRPAARRAHDRGMPSACRAGPESPATGSVAGQQRSRVVEFDAGRSEQVDEVLSTLGPAIARVQYRSAGLKLRF